MRVAALTLVVTAAVTATAASAQVRFTRGAPIELAIGDDAGLQAFALADVDADGDVDVVTVAEDLELCDAVTVVRNRGDGTFEAPRFYPDEEGDLGRPASVVVADIGAPLANPADGNADLIAMTFDGIGVIAFGDGAGNFQLAESAERIDVSSDIDGDLVGAAVSDFDGRRGADLVLLDDGGLLVFLCNTGFGTFEACPDYILPTGDDNPLTLEVGDVDGNGRADVVVLDRGPRNGAGSLRVFRGRGDGSFEVLAPLSIEAEPTDLAVGRINDDAIDDVVVAFIEQLGGDSIQTLLGRTTAALMPRPVVDSLSFSPSALGIGDFDQDGLNDLVAPQRDDDFFSAIMRGDGIGGFELVSFTGNGAASGLGRAVAVADLDGDTNPDFVVLRADGSELRIAINVSDQIPTPTSSPTVTASAGASATPTPAATRTPSFRPSPVPSHTATHTATPSASPTSTRKAGVAADDDGCALDPSPSRGASGLLLITALWALVRRWLSRPAPPSSNGSRRESSSAWSETRGREISG